MLAMIGAALGPTRPGTQFAMLDVKNARLHMAKSVTAPRLPLLLRGEAQSFATIYAAV